MDDENHNDDQQLNLEDDIIMSVFDDIVHTTTDQSHDHQHNTAAPASLSKAIILDASSDVDIARSATNNITQPKQQLYQQEIDNAKVEVTGESSGAASFNRIESIVKEEEEDEILVWEPTCNDVLTGRGAYINVHPGNQQFRALCYAQKEIYDSCNYAGKKRIATQIWDTCQTLYNARFLSQPKKSIRDYRPNNKTKSPWIQQPTKAAILKVAQTIRDYKRPDRIDRGRGSGSRNRNYDDEVDCTNVMTSTTIIKDPTDNINSITNNINNNHVYIQPSATPANVTTTTPVTVDEQQCSTIYENPAGIETNDVLCGRGAFVNGHYGNQYLRTLALERKHKFDTGDYTEKRILAKEIVHIIQHKVNPPGRFLRPVTNIASKITSNDNNMNKCDEQQQWEELDIERAITKACQVMRDIDRPDRKYRIERQMERLNRSASNK